MTINDLQRKLEVLKVPEGWCSFKGGLPSDAYCIEKSERGWNVYYSEKGGRYELRTCYSEEDAVSYFVELAGKNLGLGS